MYRSLFLLFTVLLFAGMAMPVEKCRVKQMIHFNDKDRPFITYYSYYPDGRIHQTMDASDTQNYRYLPGRILRDFRSSQYRYTDTLILNARGLVMTMKSGNKDKTQIDHEYNKDGQLIHTKNHSVYSAWIGMQPADYTYENGNMTSLRIEDANGNTTFTQSYQYYSDSANSLRNENFGLAFVGVDSKNPKKYSKTVLTGQNPYFSKYVHYYDSKGRIIATVKRDLETGHRQDSICYSYYGGVYMLVDER
jgi:hypothetical protein